VWGLVPETNPFNDPSRRLVVRITVTAEGKISGTEILTQSGLPELDDLGAAIIRETAPWPVVPATALSDDGQLYIEWALSRDYRQCAELRVVPRQDPIDEAVPRFLAKKKDDRAWARVEEVAKTSPDPVLAWFARLWLTRALEDNETAPAAAAGLLAVGDKRGVKIVQQTVQKGGPGAILAAQALMKAQVPVCPIIKDGLVGAPGPTMDSALAILRIKLEPECIGPLGAVAANAKGPMPARMAAIKMLSESSDAAALAALSALKNDSAPGVRSAALLAGIKPGAGRAVVFKMIPFLKDPSAEVRGAASAGIVRAAGDAELAQLYLLFKEKDARPYEMVAFELGKYGTEPTAQLLGKMLKKDDKRVRLAAATALMARTDAFAKPLIEGLASDPDPEIKNLAGPTAGASDNAAKKIMAAPLAEARKLFPQLAIGPGRPAAANWLIAKFPDLDALARVEVLGQWLIGAAPGASALSSAQ
jgi:hypothetical protein